MFDARDQGNGYVETDPSGRYGRFDEVLGKGAMKTVYRAFDEVSGMEVAWNQAKLCVVMQSPEVLQRMYSEVHLLSTLSHPSIIRFHASWIDAPRRTFNFITEMFTSGTLRQYRRRYRRVEIGAVKRWARQIAGGLVYLHRRDPPVIHRDLKCDNVFVNGHLGEVKIGDLGLAAVLRGSQTAHSVIGTPEFMAPELYEEDYNQLVDVYSFGMCLLEMLTGEYPYSECSNPAQIYKKVTSGKLPDAFYRLQEPDARRFVGRCLEKALTRPSAEDLLSDPFLRSDDRQPSIPSGPVIFKPNVSADGRGKHCGRETDMTITGSVNPDDDAIYLKVQIAHRDGQVRNIYFPFDTISDSPLGVATEMVKELEIKEWEPCEIASIITREIMNLVPDWKRIHHDEYEDPYSPPSPASSTQNSALGTRNNHLLSGQSYKVAEWLQDDDDVASSVHSGMYSSVNYSSGNEQESISSESLIREASKKPTDSRRLLRNRSMVDLRSRLLHRNLVDQLSKRLFKTVGAVENIGFQMPVVESSKSSSSKKQGKKLGK